MAEKKRCMVCNKEFTPCSRCSGSISGINGVDLKPWRQVVCCPEHYSFHVTLNKYVRGTIDKETAGKELRTAIRYYGEVDYNDNVKHLAEEIMAEPVVRDVETNAAENAAEVALENAENVDAVKESANARSAARSAKGRKKE